VQPVTGWGKYVPDADRILPQSVIDKFIPNAITAIATETTETGLLTRWSASKKIDEPTDETVEITLIENVRFTGRVLLNDRPLSGAKLKSWNDLAKVYQYRFVWTETGAQGNFEFLAEPVSDLKVSMLHGFPFQDSEFRIRGRSSLSAEATNDPQHFVFPDINIVSGNSEIRGTVIDENDKPVVGAHVGCINNTSQVWLAMLANQTSTSMPTLVTKTDSNGKFAFSGLPEGIYPVVATVRKNERWTEKTSITEALQARTGDSDIEIVLRSTLQTK
jgi:uncharacterized GH25 family protein